MQVVIPVERAPTAVQIVDEHRSGDDVDEGCEGQASVQSELRRASFHDGAVERKRDGRTMTVFFSR